MKGGSCCWFISSNADFCNGLDTVKSLSVEIGIGIEEGDKWCKEMRRYFLALTLVSILKVSKCNFNRWDYSASILMLSMWSTDWHGRSRNETLLLSIEIDEWIKLLNLWTSIEHCKCWWWEEEKRTCAKSKGRKTYESHCLWVSWLWSHISCESWICWFDYVRNDMSMHAERWWHESDT